MFCHGFRQQQFNRKLHRLSGGCSRCKDPATAYTMGMCDIFPKVTPANVTITYYASGLGFYGNPNGPTPTVEVKITNVQYAFIFLPLANVPSIMMPSVSA